MKTSRLDDKHLKKTLLFAAAIIGASTLLFQGLTQAVVAAEYNKSTTFSTNYANATAQPPAATQNSPAEGYKKAHYSIRGIDLEYFRNQMPSSKDMPKADAAEIGARALWDVYGLSLEGQVIEMGYLQVTSDVPRSRWYADVLIAGERSYSFEVDSVTGELFALTHSRTLDKSVSIAFDAALDKNPQEYATLARQVAEKLNIVHGAVAAADYNGQGYSNNDPTITFNLRGENGEVASLTFSRYDKALLGISYNAGFRYTLEYMQKLDEEAQQRAAQRQKATPSAHASQTPALVITTDN